MNQLNVNEVESLEGAASVKAKKTPFFLNKNVLAIVACLFLTSFEIYAQGNGASSIGASANTVASYFGVVKNISQAIGGIVALVGAIRIYSKWSNGDQDINKELMGWGGAALFLIIAPEFVTGIFNGVNFS